MPTAKRTTKKTARNATSKRAASSAARTSAASPIRFTAILLKPKGEVGGWLFLKLPKQASAKLPSRGQVSVEGTFAGLPFCATLEPDGAGGHWMKVDRDVLPRPRGEGRGEGAGGRSSRSAASLAFKAGDEVELEVTPLPPERALEPDVPADIQKMLSAAPAKVREMWADITPIARRDWIQWMTSGKKAETRTKRIATACDMMLKGKRRPCCFDRTGGMYSSGGKSVCCPVADE